MAAERAGRQRRLWSCFQPHRTRDQRTLWTRFGRAFGRRRAVLTDIYAAGEDPIPGVTVDRLCRGDSGGTDAGDVLERSTS